MTREETIQILAILKVAYPRFYQDTDDIEPVVNLWSIMLSDFELSTIKISVQKYIAQNTFPPTIADIRRSIIEVNKPKELTADEAWEQVANAVRRYGSYREQEALQSMDKDVALQLKRFGYKDLCMCSIENPDYSVYKANFMRVWDANKKFNKEQAMIPAEIRKSIESIVDATLITGSDDKNV